MTLRLPDELHEALRRESFELRIPMTQLVIAAITQRAKRHERGCDVCGMPHVMVSTPGGFRFCETHRPTEPCRKQYPEVGHEDEGYSCSTHNHAWNECPHRSTVSGDTEGTTT